MLINNQGFKDVAPAIVGNRTLLPVRAIAEALGADVEWTKATRTVTITLDGEVVEFSIGELADGMDVPAQIIDNRTMVPVRFVAERLGANVLWFPATETVQITR